MPRTKDVPLWLPPLLLALALIALFHRLLLGETLFWGLPTLQFYPWRQFAFSELGAGRLPTWNPYLGAGAPLLANYQTALFYPPNWPLLVVPDAVGMSLIAVATYRVDVARHVAVPRRAAVGHVRARCRGVGVCAGRLFDRARVLIPHG